MKSKKIGIIRNEMMAMAVVACLAWGWVSAAQASSIVYTPTGAIASSELASSPVRYAVETINNSGLATILPTSPFTISSTADLPEHNEDPNNMWLTDNATTLPGMITFDLGSVETINTLYIWNYAEESAGNEVTYLKRGANQVELYVNSTNTLTLCTHAGSVQFLEATPAPYTSLGAFNTPVVAYTIPAITAQYIEFDITSNWGDPSFVGLSEVRFGFVPEPSAGLLCLLGGVGMLTRRRRLAASRA